MRKRFFAALVAAIALAGAGRAEADPIVYSLSDSSVSGTIDSQSFTGATVTITIAADTSGSTAYDYTAYPGGSAGYELTAPAGSVTITVSGGGLASTVTDTITDSIVLADAQTGTGSPALVIYDYTTNQTSGNQILGVKDSFYTTYDLKSQFGPLTDTTGYGTTGVAYGTSGGSVTFSNVGISITAQAVPEPSSLVLTILAAGLAAGSHQVRRRRRSARP